MFDFTDFRWKPSGFSYVQMVTAISFGVTVVCGDEEEGESSSSTGLGFGFSPFSRR